MAKSRSVSEMPEMVTSFDHLAYIEPHSLDKKNPNHARRTLPKPAENFELSHTHYEEIPAL